MNTVADNHTNDKHNAYMRSYIAKSPHVTCEVCGTTYKKYKEYRHMQSKRHQLAAFKKNDSTKFSEIEEQLKALKLLITQKKE